MASMTAKNLIERGDALFSKRSPILSLWQEMADNFYVERANFNITRSIGTDFASNLTTGYPLMCRRDLGNAFSAMLRPTAKQWFHTRTQRGGENTPDDARAWLEFAEGVQRRALYDRYAGFVRATKEGDHDFAAFGQCVLTCEHNRDANTLLFRNWHLRDVVWVEGIDGRICEVHRKWKTMAIEAVKRFPNIGPKITQIAEKTPHEEVELRHILMRAEDYETSYADILQQIGVEKATSPNGTGGKKFRTPYVSVYVGLAEENVLEEIGLFNRMYVIPRWQTVSGSQYSYSPATIVALPDARLIQAMTYTLLEAGEKATNPPMAAVQTALRSDVNVYAGGVTWIDAEYDERLGEALRPLALDKNGIPTGFNMIKDVREQLAQGFYLNKLTMPSQDNPEMTAFEVGQRVQEYIRNALPLFEPMEYEYNGELCDISFDILMRNNAFGSPLNMPSSLRGADIQFAFESPLNDAIERQVGQKLQEARGMMALTIDIDPSTRYMLDGGKALRDAFRGLSTPARWLRSDATIKGMVDQAQQAAQASQALTLLQQGATAGKTIGDAASSMREGFGDAQGDQPTPGITREASLPNQAAPV